MDLLYLLVVISVVTVYIKFTSGQAFIVSTVQIFIQRYKYNVAMLITTDTTTLEQHLHKILLVHPQFVPTTFCVYATGALTWELCYAQLFTSVGSWCLYIG